MLKTQPRRQANRLRHTIREELEPQPTSIILQAVVATFRLVLTTQIYENYGSHCWDGEGHCPQYWKAKGGEEYHRSIGTANDVIRLGRKGIARILSDMRSKVEKSNDCWQEYTIDWTIVAGNEETYGEKEAREMTEWGYMGDYGPKYI